MMMPNQLIPPKALASTLPPETTVDESIRIWIDLIDSTERLVLAGIEREVGRERLPEAYRAWCEEQSRLHLQHVAVLARRLNAPGN